MTLGQKTVLLWISGGFLLISAALGLTLNSFASPYQGIVDRNVFGLKPMPPAIRPEDIKAPAPDLNLTGITTILGNKRALLKVPAKPPKQKEESYILTEGQSEGDIEVLTIDEVAGTANVMNHGVPQTLDLKDNAAKGPGGVPGAAPIAQGSVPPGLGSAFRQIPPRPMRTTSAPQTQQSPVASTPNYYNNTAANSGPGYSAPGNSSPGFGSVQPGQGSALSFNQQGNGFTATPDYGITADEQTVLIEANRAKLLQEGRGDEASMLPPTDLTPPDGQPLQ